MGFNEFKELFAALSGWKQNFMMFDRDRSGTVEPHEMSQAITSMGESWNVILEATLQFNDRRNTDTVTFIGYRMSPQALNGIIKRYSKNGTIFFDDYVACCVKLRSLTGAYFILLCCVFWLMPRLLWLVYSSFYRELQEERYHAAGSSQLSIWWCKRIVCSVNVFCAIPFLCGLFVAYTLSLGVIISHFPSLSCAQWPSKSCKSRAP